jgi:hypothetical protein
MKIEIDYNGAFAVCRIEPIDEPGKMVNFNKADTKSQAYALSAFFAVKLHWQREKQLEQWKKLPAIHVKRQIQVTMQNLEQIEELVRDGVIIRWEFETSRESFIRVFLNDGYTVIGSGGWLIQDAEGSWRGMSDGHYCTLMKYNKIVKE